MIASISSCTKCFKCSIPNINSAGQQHGVIDSKVCPTNKTEIDYYKSNADCKAII